MSIAKEDMHRLAAKSGWRNPWVIGWLALVLSVMLVNAIMIVLALATSPGLVNEGYYQRGQEYDAVLSNQQQSADLGWLVKIDVPQAFVAEAAATFRVIGIDQLGRPLELERVTLSAFRPSDAAADFSTELITEGEGRYVGQLTFPLKGVWDLLAVLERGDEQMSIARRVVAQEN